MQKKYLYETHLHTSPVSRCAAATVRESLEFYKELGYAGVFITNHFIDGNINCDGSLPYADKIEFYFSDYEKGVEIGREIGIDVFCGIESSYRGTDFLIYGLDKQWFLEHPEITDMKKTSQLTLMAQHGALIIQAHPFREAVYIDHIRLFPRHIHGVEIYNAGRDAGQNEMARIYCEHYGLIAFAGSDNHMGGGATRLGGVGSDEPVLSELDFVSKVKNGETSVFSKELSK